MAENKTIGIRLALRREGAFWNAYVAMSGTMEGAFLIGSISLRAATAHPEIKDGFMQLMKQVLAVAAKDVVGEQQIIWEVTDAPEHERSGHG
jgi:hypothetical protein